MSPWSARFLGGKSRLRSATTARRPVSTSLPNYNRQLLLSEVKRGAVLELWEVQRYGANSYGDRDYVAVYGMPPEEWYAKGVRLLGRTAVECTRDALGNAIGRDVAAVTVAEPSSGSTVVVDLFAGSGNTLYWLMRHLPGARGLGFELDPDVFRLTRRNLVTLALPIEIQNTDYRSGLTELSLASDALLIAFIAPPWGNALDPASGLDLRRTSPPVFDIVNLLFGSFTSNRILCAIQVYERLNAASLGELESCFDWSALSVYAMNAPGQNHGVLLGSKHWRPQVPES